MFVQYNKSTGDLIRLHTHNKNTLGCNAKRKLKTIGHRSSHVSVFASYPNMLSRLASSTTRHALRNVRALSSERPEPQQVESLLQIGSRRIYDSTHDAYREVSYNPTSKN